MILTALAPIFALILIGFLLSHTPLSKPESWAQIERLIYYIFFPALLLLRLSSSNFDWGDLADISKVIGLALLVMTLLIIILARHIAPERASISSVYQGSVRFNTYIGLALFDALYGDSGLLMAALCLAIYIPVVNILAVISLSISGGNSTQQMKAISNAVLTNPLVLACVAGMALSYWSVDLPEIVTSTVSILSQPALPLGLLAVGAGIHFTTLGAQWRQLSFALVNKLLLFPGLILWACLLLEVDGLMATVLLILTALPSPPSAYILARQLGGNAPLMANIITVQTLASFAVIPLWIEVAGRFF